MKFDKNKNNYETRWIKKIKAINILGGFCKICGESNLILLDFHHSLGEKEKLISKLIHYRWSRIKKEIEKCVLYCANCHSEVHCGTHSRHDDEKKIILTAIERTKCENCGYRGKNLASLDFHHIDKNNKEFIISDALNRNIPVSLQSLYDEVKKCKVLCRNCHRLEHFDKKKFKKSKKTISTRKLREISSPVSKEKVFKMFKQGIKQSEIAKKMGCARSTICGIMKKYV